MIVVNELNLHKKIVDDFWAKNSFQSFQFMKVCEGQESWIINDPSFSEKTKEFAIALQNAAEQHKINSKDVKEQINALIEFSAYTHFSQAVMLYVWLDQKFQNFLKDLIETSIEKIKDADLETEEAQEYLLLIERFNTLVKAFSIDDLFNQDRVKRLLNAINE